MNATRPPGPHTWLPWGNFPAFRKDILGFLTGIAYDFGDMSSFRLGPFRCCIVNDPDIIEEVFLDRGNQMVKHWDLRQLKFALGDGLLTSEGALWEKQRRLVQPAFHHGRVNQYATRMVTRAKELSDRWQPGETRDVHADMMALTLEIVAELLLGADLSSRVREVSASLDQVMTHFEHLMTGWLPVPLAVPTPQNLRTRAARNQLDRLVNEIITTRRRSASGDDLLCWMIEAQDVDGSVMDDRQLRDEVVTLLTAGHETTAIALSWTFYLLARHPEVANRLRLELDGALGNAMPTPQSVVNVPYVRQVIQESMRLFPPAWAFGREPTTGIELGGYQIPKGTQILVLPWITHRDPRYFEDPLSFRPDRWDNDWKPRKWTYIPFGGGPRFCVGKTFAMMEATILLAILARRWRFELVDEHRVEIQPTVTLRPRFGVRVRLHRE